MKRTGPSNPELKGLIRMLEKEKAPVWRDVVEHLNKASRRRVEVNLSAIDKHVQPKAVVVVPGIVLGNGSITKPVTVASFRFSSSARQKIEAVGGKCMSIAALVSENRSGSGLVFMG